MEPGTLLMFAKDAEDVASGLHTCRDNLPRNGTKITGIIRELFAVSTVLHELDNTQKDRRFEPSFYRIEEDLDILCASLRRTFDCNFDMFGRASGRSWAMVWDDLLHRMVVKEGLGLLERLELYHDFLSGLRCRVTGDPSPRVGSAKQRILELLDLQEVNAPPRYAAGQFIDDSASTPRPFPAFPARPPIRRLQTPMSPTVLSDDWDPYFQPPPPVVPEVPPLSPTFTSGSSHTMSSSQTSYSNEGYYPFPQPPPPPSEHWALDVFNGTNPSTEFRRAGRTLDSSACYGEIDVVAQEHLAHDGFIRVLQLSFDNDALWTRLYWRPPDNRARILIMASRERHYCTALQNLKIIRHGSCLQLCRLSRAAGSYTLWARLNFGLYERMVLFYNTFVAMKRQDHRAIPHIDLEESFELSQQPDPRHEQAIYAGCIKDGDLRHALRLFKDRGSGVVRLEACALRGPMKDVPLWTAFVTRYKEDPDHVFLERDMKTVSLAALRPPPYVFVHGYEPPMNRRGEYVLHFRTIEDARQFVETWTQLSRTNSM